MGFRVSEIHEMDFRASEINQKWIEGKFYMAKSWIKMKKIPVKLQPITPRIIQNPNETLSFGCPNLSLDGHVSVSHLLVLNIYCVMYSMCLRVPNNILYRWGSGG